MVVLDFNSTTFYHYLHHLPILVKEKYFSSHLFYVPFIWKLYFLTSAALSYGKNNYPIGG